MKKVNKVKRRALKVKQKNYKYKYNVLKCTLGEVQANPEVLPKILKEHSYRRKRLLSYLNWQKRNKENA